MDRGQYKICPLAALFGVSSATINPLSVGFVLGAIVGCAQGALISPWVNPLLWTIATSVGSGLAFPGIFIIVSFFSNLSNSITILVIGLTWGLLPGIFKWFALKNKFKKAYLWIPINSLSVRITIVSARKIVGFILGEKQVVFIVNNKQFLKFTLFFGLIYGIICQYFLFKILNCSF